MVRALGVNTNVTKTLGLMISNGLIALSGALVTQQQGYADVRMGIGAIVIGLASIVIGEVIFGHKGCIWNASNFYRCRFCNLSYHCSGCFTVRIKYG